jgi:hypothetical protein
MRMYRCPYPPFPFPTYHPDTGTGFSYRNPTFVGPLVQPLFKQATRRLTLLYTSKDVRHWSQPAAPTTCKCTPTSHGQQALHFLIPALVFLSCLLDSLTGRIPYAEPSDFGTVFPTQHCNARDTHQIQAVAVAQKRLPLIIVHALP